MNTLYRPIQPKLILREKSLSWPDKQMLKTCFLANDIARRCQVSSGEVCYLDGIGSNYTSLFCLASGQLGTIRTGPLCKIVLWLESLWVPCLFFLLPGVFKSGVFSVFESRFGSESPLGVPCSAALVIVCLVLKTKQDYNNIVDILL